MMRQPVGAQVQLAVAKRLLLEHHRDRIRASLPPAPQTAPARWSPARHARCRSSRAGWSSRSAAPRMSRLPSARSGCGNRCRQQPHQPRRQRLHAGRARTGRSRIRSPPQSPPAPRPHRAPRSGSPTGRTWRSRVATGSNRRRKPRHLKARPRIVLERQHHLEQRMTRQRARRVEHLNQPLERHLLMAVGRQIARAHPPRSARAGSGLPDVSVRSTSVLTKNPTRSSSALSVRPAIGLPIAMSLPAPSRLSSPARPACSTMNRLAPHAARKPQEPAMQLRATAQSQRCRRDGSPPQAAADRLGSSICIRQALQLSRQNASWREIALSGSLSCPAPPAATACSRHIAPASGASSRRLPPQPRRIAARKIRSSGAKDHPSPAMWCSSSSSTCSLRGRAQTDAPATAARARAQTPPPRQLPAPRASSSSRTRARPPARPRRAALAGSPAAVRPRARETSCAGSRGAPPHRKRRSSAATSSAPVKPHRHRNVVGRAPCPLQPMQEPEPRCAYDSGISAGRATPAGQRAPACAATRAAPAPQPWAPRTAPRIDISTSRLARIRLISRVASSEWPPSSKKLSSMPTRPSPSTSANSPHRISSCGVRGARPSTAAHHRRRQRAPVELAVRRQRKPLQQHKRRRHHVVRKALRHMRPKRRRIRRAASRARHHIGDEPLVAGASSRAITAACATAGMAQQRRLDLAGLNAKAAQLHLRVGAPQKLQHPVRAPARQVPAAVHPAPRRPERVRNKPLRRQPRPSR